MTKLLEFKPNGDGVYEPDDYKTTPGYLMDTDMWYSCTPDLPLLRFKKNIWIFVWDELKSYSSPEKAFRLAPKHWTTKYYRATTKYSFLPFMNVAKDKGTLQDMLVPSNSAWNKSISGLEFDHKPKPLSGQVLNVSLEGLQAFDKYYQNTMVHQRSKISVTCDAGEIQAWIYTIPTRAFTKYLPHEQDYRLVRGFEPAVCDSLNDTTYTSTFRSRHSTSLATK